jgi:hypothetical protein
MRRSDVNVVVEELFQLTRMQAELCTYDHGAPPCSPDVELLYGDDGLTRGCPSVSHFGTYIQPQPCKIKIFSKCGVPSETVDSRNPSRLSRG